MLFARFCTRRGELVTHARGLTQGLELPVMETRGVRSLPATLIHELNTSMGVYTGTDGVLRVSACRQRTQRAVFGFEGFWHPLLCAASVDAAATESAVGACVAQAIEKRGSVVDATEGVREVCYCSRMRMRLVEDALVAVDANTAAESIQCTLVVCAEWPADAKASDAAIVGCLNTVLKALPAKAMKPNVSVVFAVHGGACVSDTAAFGLACVRHVVGHPHAERTLFLVPDVRYTELLEKPDTGGLRGIQIPLPRAEDFRRIAVPSSKPA